MWAYESVFYQIYPIGFCRAPRQRDGVCVPRIRKIAEWADYLEELGVGAVILNPVFESSSHGYDTRDLTRVDCRLGTNDDLADVVRTLHAHGIRVVLDAVFNHVGREFWAFQDVHEHRENSPYCDWFHIDFGGDSAFGDGFWYEGWEGVYDLVKLNLQNPEVVSYLLDVVRTWRHEFNIDGLRLDVAYALDQGFIRKLRSVADELSAEEPSGEADARAEGTAEPGTPISGSSDEHLSRDRTFVLIGETLHGDYSQLVNPDMLDSCTNYECYKGLYSSFNSQNMFEIAHSLHRQFGDDPWCVYRGLHLLSFADNHDVTRLASILNDQRCLRPAYGVLFGMPGIPCIYYGSEWGAEGEKGAHDDYDLRPAFEEPAPNELTAWIRRLVAVRTGRGFEGRDAAEQSGDAADTSAAAARAFAYGGYRNVVITNKQLLFERHVDADADGPAATVYVAVNAVDEPFRLEAGELNGTFCDLLADDPEASVTLAGAIDLAPFETRYLMAL